MIVINKIRSSKNTNNNSYIHNSSRLNDNNLSMNEILSLIWGAKEILRGDFKKTEWGKIILPFIVLKRLDSILEPTKDRVIAEYEKIKNENQEYIDARLNKIAGYQFHNKSKFTLDLLTSDDQNILKNLQEYLSGFSENVNDIFENFKFGSSVNSLDKQGILYQMVQRFASSELDFDPKKIDNHMMGTIYEEVIRRANETINEEAGDHFTPREVIELMVNLLFSSEKEFLNKKGKINTIYDPAAGTGGMLSIASDYIEKINPDTIIDTYGQELNPETYAICKSDMLIRGLELDKIKLGNSLIGGEKGDGFVDKKFHYMLSNPPFGVDWGKKYEKGILDEASKGNNGKYGAGLPRKSDGSLLFLLHMISKMKTNEEGGSRIAIVLNGSPLFTGEADSGENKIRKWIIENDMLETIIALPNQLFYNTGIFTYIWIVTNNKDEKRKGRIQLINASGEKYYTKMKTSLGQKRNFINTDQIQKITDIYESFKSGEFCKIFDNEDFGYRRITIERPLKLNFQISEERLDRLKNENSFHKLDGIKGKLMEPTTKDVLEILTKMSNKIYKDHNEFQSDLSNIFYKSNFNLSSSLQKAIINALSERDEEAVPLKDNEGNLIPDPDLRDYEDVPLKDNVDKYFDKEVKPFVPDAWIDNSTRDKVGYEIPFNKYFFVYKPQRSLAEIDSNIEELQNKISEELRELMK